MIFDTLFAYSIIICYLCIASQGSGQRRGATRERKVQGTAVL